MSLPGRIVDAHHHLWDLAAAHRYPWLMERGKRRFFGDPAPIQRDYLVADFRADIGALPVTASVHIQVSVAPGDELRENEWLESVAEAHGLPSAIVAFADLTRPDIGAFLDRLMEASRLRGVRQIIGRSEAEDARTGSARLLEDPAFLVGLKALAARGLAFDLQLIPSQMADAARLLRKVPDLRVALCHGGSLSDFSPQGRARWAQGIALLAELPGTICKVSGFGMFDPAWTADSVREPFARLTDAFGPQRMAFGSNYPVEKLARDYRAVWHSFADLTADWGAEDRTAIFAGTAESFYRL